MGDWDAGKGGGWGFVGMSGWFGGLVWMLERVEWWVRLGD